MQIADSDPTSKFDLKSGIAAGHGGVQHSAVASEEGERAEPPGARGCGLGPPVAPRLGHHGQLLLPAEGANYSPLQAPTLPDPGKGVLAGRPPGLGLHGQLLCLQKVLSTVLSKPSLCLTLGHGKSRVIICPGHQGQMLDPTERALRLLCSRLLLS